MVNNAMVLLPVPMAPVRTASTYLPELSSRSSSITAGYRVPRRFRKVGTFNESLDVHRQHGVRISVRPGCQKVSSRLLQEGASGVAGQASQRASAPQGPSQRHSRDDVVGTSEIAAGQAHVSLTSVRSLSLAMLSYSSGVSSKGV